jgi:hypothetical protein
MKEDTCKHTNLITLVGRCNNNTLQDRQVRKWMISEVKQFLEDSRIFYNRISSLENNSLELKGICNDFNLNKIAILQNLQYNYTNELNFLKDVGGDVSNYPRYLTKPKK